MASRLLRKSRRVAGNAPDAPPHPLSAGARTELRGLLATNCKQGRACYDEIPSRRWRLDEPFAEAEDADNPAKDDDSVFADCISISSEDSDEDAFAEDFWMSSDIPHESVDENSIKLISFPALKCLIENTCVCKECHRPVVLTQETFGLATNVCVSCVMEDKCWKPHSMTERSETLRGEDEDDGSLDSASSYLLNYLLVFAMQQLGLGQASVSTFLRILGIRASLGNQKRWSIIQDAIGEAEQAVQEEVLSENVVMAVDAAKAAGAPTDNNSRVGLTCSIDGAWQKRSSSRRYDSPSGHNILVNC